MYNHYYLKPKKTTSAQVIWHICRLLFGFTFVVSGFVKAVDPLGLQYKIEDYLIALNLTELSPLALTAAFILCSVEFVIGLNFVFSIRMRESSFVGLLFMSIMTPLTLWIAIADPVTDCGCFGDAIILSNWATFWKNIVLLTAVIIVVVLRKKVRDTWLSPFPSWTLTVTFFIIPMALGFYALRFLPIIDFRPYKIGNNIIELMTIPEDAPKGESKTTLIYEKDGVEKEFTLQNYPANDTSWHFVDQKTVQIKEGYVPPIHDFAIIDNNNDDITTDILYYPDTTYLVVMYDLTLTRLTGLESLVKLHQYAIEKGQPFYVLTASGETEREQFSNATNTTFNFCSVDPITLKTIIRANPGVVVLKEGTILNKYAVY